MATVNSATARYEGLGKEGNGHIKTKSGVVDNPYGFNTRFEGAPGTNPEELIAAIRAVHLGEAYLCPSMTKAVLKDYLAQDTDHVRSRYDSLTSREREVLHLIADGKTSREIAEVLHLSVKTVEKHRANVMRKLELHNLAEVIKYAIRKGLIDVDEC